MEGPCGRPGNEVEMRMTTGIIIANTAIRPGLHLLDLYAPYIAQAVQPGQYCMVRCGDTQATDPLLRRPFFLHATQRARQQCSLLVAASGRGSAWLTRQPEHARLDILGPMGHGWEIRPGVRNLLLIGDGAAIAALTLLAQVAIEQELAVTLLCQFANDAEVYPPTLLAPEIEYHVTTATNGERPLLERIGDSLAWADAVYCSVSLETAQTLYQRYERLRQKHIAQSLITRPLVCANGACLTCAIETQAGSKLVCRDGPVFTLEELV